MNIFITGVSGFIGSALARFLTDRGYNVSGSVRNSRVACHNIPVSVKLYSIDLGEKFNESCMENQDLVIHCAYDLTKGNKEKNIAGTKLIFNAATKMKVAQQLFITSSSAHPEATSEYGQTKFELESFFIKNNHTIIRPGLVIGPGGLFMKMDNMIKRFPLLPLIDGGNSPVPLIYIEDACRAIEQIILSGKKNIYDLFVSEEYSMKDLLVKIKTRGGYSTVFLPIPGQLIFWPLWIIEKFINLPVGTENIDGYRANMGVARNSDLKDLTGEETLLTDMIKKSMDSINMQYHSGLNKKR